MKSIHHTAIEFIQSIQSYYKLYDSFCSTFQNGVQSSKEIEIFKKASIINHKLIEETYEYCYNDITTMNNTKPIISATKMNVLYVGPENPICIAVPTYSSTDFYATITDGEILKSGECYKVKVFNVGRNQICVYDKKTNKGLGCSEFRVKRVPDPVVSYAGLHGGFIDKQLLLASAKIEAKIQNFDFDIRFPITFYSVRIACKGDTVSYQGIGNRFTPEIIEAFQKIDSGANIYIENVVIYREDLGYRTLETILFKIE